MKKFSLIILTLFSAVIFAQAQDAKSIAADYIQTHTADFDLQETDVDEYRISDEVYTKHNGVTHIYIMQQQNGIDIYNAISTINIGPDGEVISAHNRFIGDVDRKVNTSTPVIAPDVAVHSFLETKGIFTKEKLNLQAQGKAYVAEQTSFSRGAVKVRPIYTLDGEVLRLCWDVEFDEINAPDYWSVRVDAVTGKVIDEHNYTVSCSFGEAHVHGVDCVEKRQIVRPEGSGSAGMMMEGSYNIFELPIESPIHGVQELVTDPAIPEASPFGWHTTRDDMPVEFTITRGNNVHAYADRNAANSPSDPEPDGGEDLIFDFGHDPSLEPNEMRNSAITNLFYTNNMIHDITYLYGFDEVAGNFQANNFEQGGFGTDYVLAEGLDGSGTNNANFATPPDGGSGRMQMFLWNSTAGVFFGENPASIVQSYEVGLPTDWGPGIGPDPVEGSVAIVDDGTQNGTFGCEEIVNADEIAGKVAFIDRGGCFFSLKARRAEDAGAIGVIICNFEDNVINMAAGDDGSGANITIPAVMMANPDCEVIRMLIEEGEDVEVRFEDDGVTGPTQLAGSFDNGIIAHEYAHGISNRLTGGPSAAGCLGNDEQMGEGWSDFFTLVTTVEPGDEGTDRRGIGNYAISSTVEGNGIRRAPYSTDISIYPFTYKDIIGTTAPHPLGEVWAATLWDMYWALVDVYGYDADWSNKESGNAIALQLVMDGMKMQPCSPGFLDGRDAIIEADRVNNNGENFCLIWEVFARRGLGFFADQGSSDDRNDLTEGYLPFPPCLNRIVIEKSGEDVIQAGEDITVDIRVVNYKEGEATEVVVTDEVPDGVIVDESSINMNGSLESGMVTWNLGTLASLDTVDLSYVFTTPETEISALVFSEDFEDGDDNWLPDLPSNQGPNIFGIDDLESVSGDNSYFIAALEEASDAAAFSVVPVELNMDNPTLRFWTQYDTEVSQDGGLIEVSADGGMTWEYLDNAKYFRNGYPGALSFQTLVLPNLDAFSGNSNGWVDSYADLSEWQGESILLRLRFGTSEATGGLGWWLDDIEIADIVTYQSEACVQSSDPNDEECVSFSGKGVIIDAEFISSTYNEDLGIEYSLQPNPAGDFVTVQITTDQNEEAVLSLKNMNGQALMERRIALEGTQSYNIDLSRVAAGVYIVEILTTEGRVVKKLIVN